MGATDNRIVLPAVTIELFPQPQIRVDDVLDPAHSDTTPRFIAPSTSFRRTLRSRSRHRPQVMMTRTTNPARAMTATSGVTLGEGGSESASLKNAFRAVCSAPVRGWGS